MNKLKLISMFILIWTASLRANGQPAAAAAGAGAGNVLEEAAQDTKRAHDQQAGIYNLPEVEIITYSPNGKWVAAVSTLTQAIHGTPNPYEKSILQIFAVDPVTGLWNRRANFSLEIKGIFDAITFSPNSSFLAVCSSYIYVSTLLIYSVNQNSGALSTVSDEEARKFLSMAFSPNGRLLAIRNTNGIDLYAINPDTGKPILPSIPYTISNNLGGNNGSTVSFSSDSSVLLASDHNNSALVLFKVHEGHAPSLTEFLKVPLPNEAIFTSFAKPEAYLIPHSNLMVVQESIAKITGHNGQGIAINEQGTGIEVFALKTEAQKATLTPTDSMKFEVEFEDVDFAEPKAQSEIKAYFNKNLVAMYQNNKKNIIHLVSIDTRTGKIHPFAHSSFTLKNEDLVTRIAFSPDNTVLAAVFPNGVQLYEIDENAGTLMPLTGNPLHHAKERHKKAAEALGGSTSPILPADIVHGPLYEYIVGPKQAQEKQITEDTQAKALNDAIAKTKKERESKDANATELFKLIKDGKDDAKSIEQYLTPFTINARDDEDKTPLIAAAYYQKNNIAQHILRYQGIIQESEYHRVTILPDVKAIDKAGNTAAIYAKIHADQKLQEAIKQAIAKQTPEKGK